VTGPEDEPELTLDGAALHAAVEGATDHAAAGPWEALGPERTERLAALLEPVAAAARAVVPPLNPIGVPGS
jgi:helix-turn-helix protein